MEETILEKARRQIAVLRFVPHGARTMYQAFVELEGGESCGKVVMWHGAFEAMSRVKVHPWSRTSERRCGRSAKSECCNFPPNQSGNEEKENSHHFVTLPQTLQIKSPVPFFHVFLEISTNFRISVVDVLSWYWILKLVFSSFFFFCLIKCLKMFWKIFQNFTRTNRWTTSTVAHVSGSARCQRVR